MNCVNEILLNVKHFKLKALQFDCLHITDFSIINVLSCVLIDLSVSLGTWQALISDPVSIHQCNPIIKHTFNLAWLPSYFFQKVRAEKYCFLTLGNQCY